MSKSFFAVVNWSNSELYGAFFCLIRYKLTGQYFPDCGVWVTVDFDSKYKILWAESIGPMGNLFMKEKKVQNKNLHNYSNISTPMYNIRLMHVVVEVLPSSLSK